MVQIESWRFLTLGDTWKSDSFEKRRKLTMYSICGIYFCKNNICIHLRNKQAGSELGQAQLKLGLDFTSTNLH